MTEVSIALTDVTMQPQNDMLEKKQTTEPVPCRKENFEPLPKEHKSPQKLSNTATMIYHIIHYFPYISFTFILPVL